MKQKEYDDIEFTLINQETGEEMNEGAEVHSWSGGTHMRSYQDTVRTNYVLVSGEAPNRASSTGRVHVVTETGAEGVMKHRYIYPFVVGLTWSINPTLCSVCRRYHGTEYTHECE